MIANAIATVERPLGSWSRVLAIDSPRRALVGAPGCCATTSRMLTAWAATAFAAEWSLDRNDARVDLCRANVEALRGGEDEHAPVVGPCGVLVARADDAIVARVLAGDARVLGEHEDHDWRREECPTEDLRRRSG